MERYLVLENGMVFRGEGFGAEGEITAEVVFTTAMTGYMATLTDKSYIGQAVVQTFPLIGNYGYIPGVMESDRIGTSAYIVREWCQSPSNLASEGNIDGFLKAHGVVGLCGIDTRALTRILREHGVMNGCITDNPAGVDLEKVRDYRVAGSVAEASTMRPVETKSAGRCRVAALDFGMKENIRRCLLKRGCDVILLPHDTSAEDILALKPDGLLLVNGPGDPRDETGIIRTLRELLPYRLPTMGICLGHQLLALANGFEVKKLKYGHRGANQPVRCTENGRVYITSQNHGYAVVTESVDSGKASVLFENVNDGTNEGLRYLGRPMFSAQFHPEACGGPHDTEFLFDEFIKLMEGNEPCR